MSARILMAAVFCLVCLPWLGCNDTTGGSLVSFQAAVGGAQGLGSGGPIEFDTGSGFHVQLTSARFHLGAVYLNMAVPSSGGPAEPCILPGIYVGQVMGGCDAGSGVCGLDVDLLSPQLVPFPMGGQGTADQAAEAEIWLTGGDINAPDDPTPILKASGTATRGGQTWPFSATVTIGQNRALPVQNQAMPGANPICHRRIVTPIRVHFALVQDGTLTLRIDPRSMWNGVDFSTLMLSGGMAPPYVIPDQSDGAGGALYDGLFASYGVYQFAFTAPGAE
jgi:hypothetical protein